MRHIYANRIAYTIAAILVIASLIFAWVRSREIIVVPEDETTSALESPRPGAAYAGQVDWGDEGRPQGE